MKFGPYELMAYFRSNNEPMEEKRLNNVEYLVAVPNMEYYIKVIIHRNEEGKFPMEHARISLIVDGTDVNYWKRLDMSAATLIANNTEDSVSATFWGFKKSESEILAFVFNNKLAASSSSSTNSLTKSNIGQIKVEIFEAEVLNAVISNISGCLEVPTGATLPGSNSSANTKFWTAPSVATVGGSNLNNIEKFIPLPKWENKPHPVTGSRNDPLVTLELKYHTEELCNTLEHIYSGAGESEAAVPTGSLKRPNTTPGSTPSKRPQNNPPQYVDLTGEDDRAEGADASSDVGGGGAVSSGSAGDRYMSVSQQVVCVDITDEQCVTDTVVTQQTKIVLNNLCNL